MKTERTCAAWQSGGDGGPARSFVARVLTPPLIVPATDYVSGAMKEIIARVMTAVVVVVMVMVLVEVVVIAAAVASAVAASAVTEVVAVVTVVPAEVVIEGMVAVASVVISA